MFHTHQIFFLFSFTALELAKPQFRSAFGMDMEQTRCASAASVRTIKPSTASVQSTSSLASLILRSRSKSCRPGLNLRPALTELEVETLPRHVLDYLRTLSNMLSADPEVINVPAAEDILHKTARMGEDLLAHLQRSVDDATDELDALKLRMTTIRSAFPDLTYDSLAKERDRLLALERAWDEPEQCRRRTTDSDDSDRTAVSDRSSPMELFGPVNTDDVGVTAGFVPVAFDNPRKAIYGNPEPASAFVTGTPIGKNLRPVKSMVNIGQHGKHVSHGDEYNLSQVVSPRKEQYAWRGKEADTSLAIKRNSVVMSIEKESNRHSASRVRAWFKKKLTPESSRRTAVNREPEATSQASFGFRLSSDPKAARDATVVRHTKLLLIAQADLSRIEHCLRTAECSLASTQRYILQARKVFTAMLEVSARFNAVRDVVLITTTASHS